jgi:5-methylthioadenosine/S-adenosylhomocysteine deaminase
MRNIVPNLVYSAQGSEVDTVVVDGRVLVERGRVLTVDEQSIVAEAQQHAESIGRQAIGSFQAVGGPNGRWQTEGKL